MIFVLHVFRVVVFGFFCWINLCSAESVETKPVLLGLTSLKEEIDNIPAVTRGTIPQWLNGSLLRVGPGKFEIGNYKVPHWFDGLALLCRFTFSNGVVTHGARFLESNYYKNTIRTGKLGWLLSGNQDPCKLSFWDKMTQFFATDQNDHKNPANYDNTNVNIVRLENNFIAMTEVPMAIEFDPSTLKTLGKHTYKDNLEGQTGTAHLHYDPKTKESFNCLTHFGWNTYYRIYKHSGNSKIRKEIAKVEVDRPSYMHSFSLTENYIILTEIPFTASAWALLFADKNEPLFSNYLWNEKDKTYFTVVNLGGIKFPEACFVVR